VPEPREVVPEASDFARGLPALVDTVLPIVAVEAFYQQVGRALVDIIEKSEQRSAADQNVAQLARAAHARGLISTANLDPTEGLGVMHTMAVLDTNGNAWSRPGRVSSWRSPRPCCTRCAPSRGPDDNSATPRTRGAGASGRPKAGAFRHGGRR
jgi:hypothetical protein